MLILQPVRFQLQLRHDVEKSVDRTENSTYSHRACQPVQQASTRTFTVGCKVDVAPFFLTRSQPGSWERLLTNNRG